MLKKAPMFKRVRDWKRNNSKRRAVQGGQARGQAAAIIRRPSSAAATFADGRAGPPVVAGLVRPSTCARRGGRSGGSCVESGAAHEQHHLDAGNRFPRSVTAAKVQPSASSSSSSTAATRQLQYLLVPDALQS